eukprot:s699_g20.t1
MGDHFQHLLAFFFWHLSSPAQAWRQGRASRFPKFIAVSLLDAPFCMVRFANDERTERRRSSGELFGLQQLSRSVRLLVSWRSLASAAIAFNPKQKAAPTFCWKRARCLFLLPISAAYFK